MPGNSPDFNRIGSDLRRHMSGFGYSPLSTPLIAESDLFLTRAGDRIINRLFTFSRAGPELALRPEFTSLAARHYVSGGFSAPRRWQCLGPVFELDPAHSAAPRQRHSAGAELFGFNGPSADAEIMALALTGLQRLGITDWRLVVGHLGLLHSLLARFQLDDRTARFLINSLPRLRERGVTDVLRRFDQQLAEPGESDPSPSAPDPSQPPGEREAAALVARLLETSQHGAALGSRSPHDIARRLLRKRRRRSEREQVLAALKTLARWCQLSRPAPTAFDALAALAPAGSLPILRQWRQSIELLACYDLPLQQITVQPHLARNWDYYSGLVFELHTADGVHLGGGGRYDDLLHFLGAPNPVPAVGFAIRLDRVAAALPAPAQRSPMQTHKILLDDASPAAAASLARLLRHHGLQAELVTHPDAHTLRIDPAGNVALRQTRFSLDQPEALLQALRND